MPSNRQIGVVSCSLIAAAFGCSESHPREPIADAGVADVGSGDSSSGIVTSCDRIFDEPAGSSCATWLDCYRAELFCSRAHATCPEGTSVIDDTTRWIGRDGATCPDTGEVTVTVSGATALGFGVASFSHGFSVDASLIFFEGSADVTACGVPRLVVPLQPVDFASLSYVGEQETTATLALGEGNVELVGSITIDSQTMLDDGRIVLDGALDVTGGARVVRGAFRVSECRALDRSGP